MTANIVLFLRVRSRPRTGPGRLFLQSLWIRFPRVRGAVPWKSAQKQSARGIPAPGAGLIAGDRPESRKTALKVGKARGIGSIFSPNKAQLRALQRNQ